MADPQNAEHQSFICTNNASTRKALTVEQMQAAMRTAQEVNSAQASQQQLGLLNGGLGLPIHESFLSQPGTVMMMNPTDALGRNKFVPPPIETYRPPKHFFDHMFDGIEAAFRTLWKVTKAFFRRLRCELYCGHWDCPVHYPFPKQPNLGRDKLGRDWSLKHKWTGGRFEDVWENRNEKEEPRHSG